MNIEIKDFIQQYHNHPILFIGTGISKRYLKNAYTWDSLLEKIAFEISNNEEYYLSLKYKFKSDEGYDYPQIALQIENEFDSIAEGDRNGKFKDINDAFFKLLKEGSETSRFKLYIAKLLSSLDYIEDKVEELNEFKKTRKNVSSIVTTNYDELIESTFDFIPLIGNSILLSNPYGSVYKIHGCIQEPEKIVITSTDYEYFDAKYELIRAQLLSLFIHNPIIFIGYSIEDKNIKKLLSTIFTYVNPKSEIAEKIRNNFLLIEYEEGSSNTLVTEYDVKLEDFPLIKINKLKTDDFSTLYQSISELHLPISAMDIRKVENIVKELHEGGEIKVHITEDLDKLSNADKVLAIGSSKTIKYEYQTANEMMKNYFDIVEEANKQLLSLVDKHRITSTQYFPMYAFALINENISLSEHLKSQQKNILENALDKLGVTFNAINKVTTIEAILTDENISQSRKDDAIFFSIMNMYIEPDDLEGYLKKYENKSTTGYRRLLCAYDLIKYGEN